MHLGRSMGARRNRIATGRGGTRRSPLAWRRAAPKGRPTAALPAGRARIPVYPPDAADRPGAPAEGPARRGQKRGQQFSESAVYVDGRQRRPSLFGAPGVMKPFPLPEIDGLEVARYYGLAGLPRGHRPRPRQGREMQVYGSHDRITIVTGERAPHARRASSSTSREQVDGASRARAGAQTHALPHHAIVDVIMNISDVRRQDGAHARPRQHVARRQEASTTHSIRSDGVPKGTRVYVDGAPRGLGAGASKLPEQAHRPRQREAHAKFSPTHSSAYVGRRHAQHEGDRLLR